MLLAVVGLVDKKTCCGLDLVGRLSDVLDSDKAFPSSRRVGNDLVIYVFPDCLLPLALCDESSVSPECVCMIVKIVHSLSSVAKLA